MILLILLVLLAHPQWRVREAVTDKFPVHCLTVHVLLAAETEHPSAEGRYRSTLLLRRYYQSGAEALSWRLGKLPPISDLGFATVGLEHEDCWVIWHLQEKYLCLAHQSLGRPWTSAHWVHHANNRWGFSEPEDVQVEATRLLCRDVLGRREDVRVLLKQMRAEED